MGTIIVNAVGEQCPIPVVKATRALRAMTEPGILEVHVDNEIAVQNLSRMAAGHKLAAKSEKLGEKEFVVSMEVTDPAGEAPLRSRPWSALQTNGEIWWWRWIAPSWAGAATSWVRC